MSSSSSKVALAVLFLALLLTCATFVSLQRGSAGRRIISQNAVSQLRRSVKAHESGVYSGIFNRGSLT